MKSKKKAVTLMELMIAVMVLLISILALWQVFNLSSALTVQARELNTATDDLKDVLEKIKSVSYDALLGVFPDGATVAASVVGGFLLDNEVITVRYPTLSDADPNNDNPLRVEVEVTWDSKYGAQSRTFVTMKAREL